MHHGRGHLLKLGRGLEVGQGMLMGAEWGTVGLQHGREHHAESAVLQTL